MSLVGGSVLECLPGPRLRRVDLRGLDLVTHLLRTAAEHPQPVIAHAVESFFAPHMDTVGCVGVRGATAIRQVLTNSDDFAPLLPDTHDLPADVQSLSRGVFTFHGSPHTRYRAALRDLIALNAESREVMRSAARDAIGSWRDKELDLTDACRRAARHVLGAVLFGPDELGHAMALGVGRVVDGRRARRLAATPAENRAAHGQIVHASRSLATMLREWLGSPCRRGLLAALGDDLENEAATTLAVAHATAVCAASTEPTAATLGWAVLALTQRPELQAAIRDTLETGGQELTAPSPQPSGSVLDRVLLETQRLLPSSAIVTRATLRPVEIAGHVLPERCEVMISSLLAHRDRMRFPEPEAFSPDRWVDLRVTPSEFFPFGAGIRGCLGASLARVVLRTILAELVGNAAVALAFDTRIAWQMPDALMPAPGVPVLVGPPGGANGGRVDGPISVIVDFGQRRP